MEKFIGRFTLTDFFGIFLPGSILVLSMQYYFSFVLPPFEAFFGTDSLWIPVYFVLVSYVCGVLLQEISYHAFRLLHPLRKDIEALPPEYQKDVEAKYTEYMSGQKISGAHQSEENPVKITSQTIYRFVRNLSDTEQGRLPLMAAMFSMCRNASCAAFAIAVLTVTKMALAGHSLERIVTVVVSTTVGLLLWIRTERFQEYVYDNACICFLKWMLEMSKETNIERKE